MKKKITLTLATVVVAAVTGCSTPVQTYTADIYYNGKKIEESVQVQNRPDAKPEEGIFYITSSGVGRRIIGPFVVERKDSTLWQH